jgi:hypothetical protein
MSPRSVADLRLLGYDIGGMIVRVKGQGLYMVSGMEPVAIRIGYSRRGNRRLIVSEDPAEWFPELSSPSTVAMLARVARTRWSDPTLHTVPTVGGYWYLSSVKQDTSILLKPHLTEADCWLFALAEADAERERLNKLVKGDRQ